VAASTAEILKLFIVICLCLSSPNRLAVGFRVEG
jgi:hypothetical protein